MRIQQFMPVFALLFISCHVTGQSPEIPAYKNPDNYHAESKTFDKKPAEVIRSLYLDETGKPSREIFLRSWGLFPLQRSNEIEYVNRKGTRFITHDYTEGTSEDIIIALSPDGSEVEMKVELAGFLIDGSGKMLLSQGKKIDIAVGAEASSDFYGSDR